jgi:hypothetical protein
MRSFNRGEGRVSQEKLVYVFQGKGLTGDYQIVRDQETFNVAGTKFDNNIGSLFLSPKTIVTILATAPPGGGNRPQLIDNTASESNGRWMYVDLSTICVANACDALSNDRYGNKVYQIIVAKRI